MQAYGARAGPPPQAAYPTYTQNVYPPQPSPQQHLRRRTSSSTTYPRRFSSTSTTTSNNGGIPTASYVSTLRRQRATVWTSQTQFEDPRIIAARVAEKQRASSELGLSRRKAKDKASLLAGHGAASEGMGSSNALLTPGVLGVPERLSATELDDDSDDFDDGIPDMRGRDERTLQEDDETVVVQEEKRSPEDDIPREGGLEMKRRGSLDEVEARTLTMSGVRLFVANPD